MFFAATDNLAVCGYRVNLVAFETKKQRDSFVAGTEYHAVSAKEAANHENERHCRNFPQTIYANCERSGKGVVLFTVNDEFAGIY